MAGYLLDSTVVIDYINDFGEIGDLVERLFASGDALMTCDVVTCEVLSKGTDEELRAALALLDALEFVAIDPEAARWAGESRRRGGAGGNRRSLGDALIAGIAWRLDATVVTRNPGDFADQGVRVLGYQAG
jgi:predicted nucleic acid-binding protein